MYKHLISLGFQLILILLGFNLNAQLTAGQLLHYTFDGNLLDASSNGLHASQINNPVFIPDAAGNPNSAIRFNGTTNYIEFPNSPIIKPTSLPVSFTFWIRPNSTGLPQAAWCTDKTELTYHGFWFNVNPGFYAIAYGDGLGIGPPHRRSVRTTNPPNWGVWQHVVCIVRGPLDMDMYIDCIQVPTVYSGTGSGGPTAGPLNGNAGRGFTGNASGGYYYFDGDLDEFRMWNRALTAAEVQQLCTIQSCQEDSVYFQDSYCSGSSYAFNGMNLSTPGRYVANLTNVGGCDSIVVLDLTEDNNGADTNRLNVSICAGETYFFGGALRSSTGRYVDVVARAGTCDSVAVLQLLVQDNSLVSVLDTICRGQSYILGNQILNQSGSFTDTLVRLANGCDSIVNLNLFVLNQADTLWVRQEGDPCRLGYVILRAIGPGRITWQNGQTTDTLVVTASGTYQVSSSSACGNHQLTVTVEEDCLPEIGTPPEKLYIPNVFSPNGDGINDTFWVQGNGILEYEIIIFNRWGGELYRSYRMDQPWDGTYDGVDVADGVYLYVINYTVVGETFRQAHGFLTLFR